MGKRLKTSQTVKGMPSLNTKQNEQKKKKKEKRKRENFLQTNFTENNYI